jgi:hypothetical protein
MSTESTPTISAAAATDPEPVITRDEAIAAYVTAMSGNTAQQCVALIMLCDRMEHIGWMRGYKMCSDMNSKIMDAVLWPLSKPLPQDGCEPTAVPDGT